MIEIVLSVKVWSDDAEEFLSTRERFFLIKFSYHQWFMTEFAFINHTWGYQCGLKTIFVAKKYHKEFNFVIVWSSCSEIAKTDSFTSLNFKKTPVARDISVFFFLFLFADKKFYRENLSSI